MRLFDRSRIEIKTPEQLRTMRAAGLVVADALAAATAAVAPGVTTAELDAIAHEVIVSAGATPSFLGYPYTGDNDFPATICASVNDEIVHGIPGTHALVEGDLISIDCGAIVDGWHGDAAVTVPVGGPEAVSDEARALSRATEDALWAGIAAVAAGARLGDVSAAIETSIRTAGNFGIVDNCTGHGIGSAMHMPPDVPNLGRPGHGPKLTAGMAICIEPMITAGSSDNHTLDDEWTMVTDDGSIAAHFEHTIAITAAGPWVLTCPDGGVERLGALGIVCGAPE